MKIALDISQAAYQGTGVGRYVNDLTHALLQTPTDHEFVLFAFAMRQRPFFQALAKELGHPIRIFPVPPKLIPFLSGVPFDVFLGNPDLVHTSDWVELSTSCPRVTTVHDLVFRLYPDTVDPLVKAVQAKRLQKILKDKTHVIADSQSTKNDLQQIYKLSKSVIDVVYPGISPEYKPINSKEIEQVKKRLNITTPYLLSVGTQEPRKNLRKTIAAHQILKRQKGWENLSLVLAGRYGWGESPVLPPGVISLGYVKEDLMPALYSGASVFVYPSLYEGFGYPVLEALACGTPVVCGNISSLPEISGDASVLVDPNDELDIVAGIIEARQKVLELTTKGIKQARNFAWESSAKSIIQIYEELGHAHSH